MSQKVSPKVSHQSLKPNLEVAAGSLVVSESNPRYFTVASGNATDRWRNDVADIIC
jgi:hypothetical protein